jgi:hypothetical protein
MQPKSPQGQHLTVEVNICTKYPGKQPHASMPSTPSLLIEIKFCCDVVQLRHDPVTESGYIPILGHKIGTHVSFPGTGVVAGLHIHTPFTATLSVEQLYATAVPLQASPGIHGP